MKNDKKEYTTIYLGRIVLVVIFLVMIGVGFYVEQKSEFPITEKVCEDNHNLLRENDCFTSCLHGQYQGGLPSIVNSSYCKDYCIPFIETTCTDEPREDIEIGENFVGNSFTLNCGGYCIFRDEIPENYSGYVIPKNRSEQEGQRILVNISSSDLTESWLNENAECITYLHKNGISNPKSTIDYLQRQCDSGFVEDCEELVGYKCSQWTLETKEHNYTITRKK